jgi:hypothetical protein
MALIEAGGLVELHAIFIRSNPSRTTVYDKETVIRQTGKLFLSLCTLKKWELKGAASWISKGFLLKSITNRCGFNEWK